jgi:hypothetical protein
MQGILTRFTLLLFSFLLLGACKSEHPDLATAFELFRDAQEVKKYILTQTADIKNQAQLVDNKIRNEDQESVFAISEVYNYLEQVEKSMKEIAPLESSVPGHEKESNGIPAPPKNASPAEVLLKQKNYRDKLVAIKADIDAANTLLNHLKTKFN